MNQSQPEHEFCMHQYKTAVVALVVLILGVLAWAIYTGQNQGRFHRQQMLALAAAQGNIPRTAPSQGVVPGTVQPAVPGQTAHPLAVKPPAAVPVQGRVVVASTGPGLDSQTAVSFEASPYFVLYDPGTNQYKSLVNPNYNDPFGSARQAGQFMVDLGAGHVIAGSFSHQSAAAMEQLRLQLYPGVTGPVRDVLSMYQGGGIRKLHQVRASGGAGGGTVPPNNQKGTLL